MRKSMKSFVAIFLVCFTILALTVIIEGEVIKTPIAQASPNSDLTPSCCRYCSSGKACGDSCISKEDNCHQPSGCACDGTRPIPPEYEGDFENTFPGSPIPLEDELPEDMKNFVPGSLSPNNQSKIFEADQLLGLSGSTNESQEISQNSPQSFQCSVPIVATPVPGREVVVDKRKLTIELYDADKEDGDFVSLYTDKLSYLPVTLTKAGVKYTVDLGDEPGNRTIGVQYVSPGALPDQLRRPIVTPGIAINETDLVASSIGAILGGKLRLVTALQTGQKAEFDVGFPRIYVRNSTHPQSTCHIAEAWQIPPVAMEQPIPGKSGNPLQTSYPRVLTITSKAMTDKNRAASTKDYVCLNFQNGRREQRDEYPQATFVENYGSAHIKCINASDNEGSGSTIGNQMKSYGPRKVKLILGDTIEIVLGK